VSKSTCVLCSCTVWRVQLPFFCTGKSIDLTQVELLQGKNWINKVTAGSVAEQKGVSTTARTWLGRVNGKMVTSAKEGLAALDSMDKRRKNVKLHFYVLTDKFPYCPLEWSDDPVKLKEWVKMPRGTDGKSFQDELVQTTLPRWVSMQRMVMDTFVSNTHYWDYSWVYCCRKTRQYEFGKDEIYIMTDFAAAQPLHGQDSATCSTDAAVNKCIFVVLSNPRDVEVDLGNGTKETRRTCDVDVWFFYLPSSSKWRCRNQTFRVLANGVVLAN